MRETLLKTVTSLWWGWFQTQAALDTSLTMGRVQDFGAVGLYSDQFAFILIIIRKDKCVKIYGLIHRYSSLIYHKAQMCQYIKYLINPGNFYVHVMPNFDSLDLDLPCCHPAERYPTCCEFRPTVRPPFTCLIIAHSSCCKLCSSSVNTHLYLLTRLV